MSINPLNDISKVYMEEVASQNLKEASHKKPKRWWDDDGDGKGYEPGEVSGKFKRKKVKEAKEVKKWWDDDGDGKGYETGEVSGKFKGKRKVAKEGYSNWREELSEIVEVVNKDTNDQKIKEKKVNNKIKINPTIGEAVESLGGTLLEMVEIDEIDYIVESVYDELLDEGYEEDDIEEALEFALTEATVTYGHDTPTGEKKKPKNLLKAVGRLARQKLSSKVRDAKSAAKGAIASGARKVAKGALGVARKMEGDTKPSRVHSRSGTRSSSTYRGSGAGQKERVSSGSYTPPSKSTSTKKAEPVKDPWEGSETTPPKAEKKAPKATQKTTKVSSKTSKDLVAKRKAAALRAQRRNPNISSQDLQKIVDSIKEDYYDLETKSVKSGKPGEQQKKTIETLAAKARTKKKVRTPADTARRSGGPFKPSSPEEAKSNIKSWGDYWSSAAKGYKEEYVSEKTLTDAETKERERIVKSMKDKLADFEKRYPGRGKEVMYATATKMAKKIAEQYIDEAKLPRSQKKSTKEKKTSVPNRPKHLVQLDLDQAGVREVGTKKLRDLKTGKKKTTKVEPAKINVKGETGNVVRTVSTGDFHKEKLGKGETMDFSPLRNPEKFKKTTKANKHVINKSRGAVVEPNTARGAFRKEEVSLDESNGKVDNKSIIKHLKDLGYTRRRGMKVKPGHFTGDMPGSGSPGKKLIATKHDIKKYHPQKVSHIDDDPKNLEPLEKHRQETQGEKSKKRASDPKIHTQHVGSYRKRGEGRSATREHGRVRRYSGVRDAGNVPEPKTTKQVQRARKTARRGMKEAIETNSSQAPTELQNKKLSQQRDRQRQQEVQILNKKIQALRSAPKGVETDITA